MSADAMRGQRVSPLAVLLVEDQHEREQDRLQLLVADFHLERKLNHVDHHVGQSRSAARPHFAMWPCCGGYEEPCGPKGRADSLPPTPVARSHRRGETSGQPVLWLAARSPVFCAGPDCSTAVGRQAV